LGFTTPTPIQTDAIPLVLRGVDLLARAQTGTGKTAAFGLPMIERLLARESTAVRRVPAGLVLVPTRELAVQVHHALSTYAASTPLRLTAIFGGVAMNGQVDALRRGVDIVATPGRLLHHLQRRTADLSAIDVLTLDEADRMLDMGFLRALRRIVATLPRRRQTLLFSATLSDAIIGLSTQFTRDAVRVDVSARQVVAATVTHQARRCRRAQARRPHTHPHPTRRRSGARLLPDQARREPCRRGLGTAWRALGRDSRQQESGRTQPGAR
jgi:ATP-dependent RNA helicase RhlE